MKAVYVIPLDQHRKQSVEVIVLESGKFVGTQEDRRMPKYLPRPLSVYSGKGHSTSSAEARP